MLMDLWMAIFWLSVRANNLISIPYKNVMFQNSVINIILDIINRYLGSAMKRLLPKVESKVVNLKLQTRGANGNQL